MAILYKSDLVSSNSSSMLKNLDIEMDQTNKLFQTLESFETSSINVLKGESFDAIRDKLLKYKEISNLRKAAIESLKTSVKSANNHLITFMEDYEKLDDSKIPDLEAEIVRLNDEIAKNQNIINATKTVYDYDDKENVIGSHEEYVYDAATRAGAQRYIKEAEAQIKMIERELKKLRELSSQDNAALQILLGCEGAMSSYKSKSSSVRASKVLSSEVLSALPSTTSSQKGSGGNKTAKNINYSGNIDYTYDTLMNKDLRTSTFPVTADDLDYLFDVWTDKNGNYNSPLKGCGEYYIKAAEESGIDPIALIAITGVETGRGGENASGFMNNNNFFGMLYDDKGYWGATNSHYDSKEEGIVAAANRVSNFYYDKYDATSLYGLARAGYCQDGLAHGYHEKLAGVAQEACEIIAKHNSQNTTATEV